MKIGILIPVTSNNRNWKTISETYLYNLTIYCSMQELFIKEYT